MTDDEFKKAIVRYPNWVPKRNEGFGEQAFKPWRLIGDRILHIARIDNTLS